MRMWLKDLKRLCLKKDVKEDKTLFIRDITTKNHQSYLGKIFMKQLGIALRI